MEQITRGTATVPCRLVLVRHGQARSPDGSYGPRTPLSALGRNQANAAAEALAQGAAITAIYSSPFPRALETATILGDRLGCPPVVEDRLAEFEMGTAPLAFAESRPDLFLWPPADPELGGHHRRPAGNDGILELHPVVEPAQVLELPRVGDVPVLPAVDYRLCILR